VIGTTTGEISFGSNDVINLVDLTGGVLQLTSSTPYLLIQAGGGDALSDNDLYSGLTTSGGYRRAGLEPNAGRSGGALDGLADDMR
jgi:hypothetical protein